MGFTPAQVDDMTIVEYFYVCRGWRRAHESEGKGKPSMDKEQYDRLMAQPPPDWNKLAAKIEAQKQKRRATRKRLSQQQVNGGTDG